MGDPIIAESRPTRRAGVRALNRDPEASGLRRRALLARFLLLGDLVALTVVLVIAQLVVGEGPAWMLLDAWEPAVLVAALPIWLFFGTLLRLYDRDVERPDHTTVDDLGAIFSMVTLGTWLLLALSWVVGANRGDPWVFVLTWLLAVPAVTLSRALVRALVRRQTSFLQNALIVGAGDVGQLVATKILRGGSYGINIVGFVDPNPRVLAPGLEHITLIESLDRVPEVIALLDVERVIVAFSTAEDEDMIELVRSLKELDVQVDIVPRLFDSFGTRIVVHSLEGMPLVALPPMRLSAPALLMKRAVDVTLSLFGLALLSPLLAALAVMIKRDSPGPVFYRHGRLGMDRRPIRLLKFRTMRIEFCRGGEYGGDQAEAAFQRLMSDPELRQEFEENYKLAADPRVTRVGRFLRRTSLDELPQLWNVLRGDVSLVGPRPITLEELPRYGRSAKALLDVRPGLTGYWQVNGRSDTSYDERVRLDIAYVTSWSLKSDLVILAKTLGKTVLTRRGAV